MLFFLMLCMSIIGCFFIVGFGKLFDSPFGFYVFICAVWGGFCGGLGGYIKDKMGKKER